MKAIVEIFGGIPEKVYQVIDELAGKVKEKLEKKVGITSQEERENRALNGKEEFHIVDVDIVVQREYGIVIIGDTTKRLE